MRRALVLSHEPDGPAGQIEVRLRQRGFDVDTHVVTSDYNAPNEAAPFPNIDGYDVVVPMGSVRSLTRKHEIDSWIHDELDLIRRAHDAGTPILGVCFGGQLIADALGGSVEIAPVTEIGWFEIDPGPDAPNPAGPGPWMEWHHDRFTPPPAATVLAQNDNAVQLFQVGSTVGTQFHPEVDRDHVAGFVAGSSPEYLAEYGIDPERLLTEVAEHEQRNIAQCHAFVDWFLDTVGLTSTDTPTGVSENEGPCSAR